MALLHNYTLFGQWNSPQTQLFYDAYPFVGLELKMNLVSI